MSLLRYYLLTEECSNGMPEYHGKMFTDLAEAFKALDEKRKTFLNDKTFETIGNPQDHSSFRSEDGKGNSIYMVIGYEGDVLDAIMDKVKESEEVTDMEYYVGNDFTAKHFHANRIDLPFDDDDYKFKVDDEEISPYMILARPVTMGMTPEEIKEGDYDPDELMVDVYEILNGDKFVESLEECPDDVLAGIYMTLYNNK